jgi:hypothetical protein
MMLKTLHWIMGKEQNRRLWEAFVAAGSTQYSLGQFSKKTSHWLTFGSVQQITRPIVVIKLLRYFLLEIGLRNQSFLVILTGGVGTVTTYLSAAIKANLKRKGKKKLVAGILCTRWFGIRSSCCCWETNNRIECSALKSYFLLSRYLFRTTTTAAFALFSDLQNPKIWWWLQIGLYTQEDCTFEALKFGGGDYRLDYIHSKGPHFEILKFGGDYKYGIHSETLKVGGVYKMEMHEIHSNVW